jgi:uncharacterized coiled-coil protein SlyX
MSNEVNEEWLDEDQPSALPRRPRRWPLILFLLLALVLAGAGATYVWANKDGLLQLAGHEASESAQTSPGDKAMLTDLLATQQKTGDDLDALNKAVTDQQEQLKAMTDQIAALTAKVEALQTAAAPPAPPPPAPVAPPNARAQVAPKPAKKPPVHAARPAGPISVGGAPLNVAPPERQ